MNIVFSFDTVLSAVALTKISSSWRTAIVVSGVLMVLMAEHVANFLQKNRMYEVLGLFVLLLVGVMLLAEGGHIAHLAFFGYPVEPMAKSTFYFVVAALVIVDIIQGRYQKKILSRRSSRAPDRDAHCPLAEASAKPRGIQSSQFRLNHSWRVNSSTICRAFPKSYAGGKKVLDNVHLQFYPEAKIGVLGPNGSGKSTLLKIMAGLDKEYNGEAWVAEGATVGYLEQEPQLDATKDVMGNVMEGVAAKKAILDEYNALMADYNDENAEKAGKLQDIIDAQNLWDLEAQVEQAMDALRCPPGDAGVENLSGGEKRRVALTTPAAVKARSYSARRADQPS